MDIRTGMTKLVKHNIFPTIRKSANLINVLLTVMMSVREWASRLQQDTMGRMMVIRSGIAPNRTTSHPI